MSKARRKGKESRPPIVHCCVSDGMRGNTVTATMPNMNNCPERKCASGPAFMVQVCFYCVTISRFCDPRSQKDWHPTILQENTCVVIEERFVCPFITGSSFFGYDLTGCSRELEGKSPTFSRHSFVKILEILFPPQQEPPKENEKGGHHAFIIIQRLGKLDNSNNQHNYERIYYFQSPVS